jgi:dipeptidyl aminopeptidase/acylaminoacyl peptidase
MFGISDLPAFLAESEQGHVPEAQRGEFGDARDRDVRQWLQRISPASQAERIRVPLFIYQGANDVRVKPAQSRAMAAHIRALTLSYFGVSVSEFLTRCRAT